MRLLTALTRTLQDDYAGDKEYITPKGERIRRYFVGKKNFFCNKDNLLPHTCRGCGEDYSSNCLKCAR